MMQLRVVTTEEDTDDVLRLLSQAEGVTFPQVYRGVVVEPPGNVIVAGVTRESADPVIDAIRNLGVGETGLIALNESETWISELGLVAELTTPGSEADAMVWPTIIKRAYDESELNWTFISTFILSTLLAGIAIITDSQILTVGAMVLGPEFGAVVALALALVRRRPHLFALAARALAMGFVVSTLTTALVTKLGSVMGWLSASSIRANRQATSFIYHPDRWSLAVALIAGIVGVLALTSSRTGGLSGVFISVTTIPAAANIGVALALGEWDEIRGSLVQLAVSLVGMTLAGYLTLQFQQQVWSRLARHRLKRYGRSTRWSVDRYRP